MSNIRLLRGMCVLAVVASAACNGRSSSMPEAGGPGLPDASTGGDGSIGVDASVPSGDASVGNDAVVGDDVYGSPDAPVGGDAGIDVSQPRSLDLPGIVVWLDADVGIDSVGSEVMTWTDRSLYRHVFMAQSAVKDMPAIAQLNGHQAVRFNGRNRVISEFAPSAPQMDALSLGSDFIVAIVFVPEQEVTRSAYLSLAMLPWIASPPDPGLTISSLPPAFSIMMQTEPALSFTAGWSSLRVAGGFALAPQRLILSTRGGRQVQVRLNGQLQAGTATVDSNPSEGAYAPIYVGAWDFDLWGFEGTVAEMVIVRDAPDDSTEQALDDYLKEKFSL